MKKFKNIKTGNVEIVTNPKLISQYEKHTEVYAEVKAEVKAKAKTKAE